MAHSQINGQYEIFVQFIRKTNTQTTWDRTIATVFPYSQNLVKYLGYIGKVFEIVILEYFLNFVEINKLLSGHKPNLRPNNCCTNQLLPIVHDIHASFDVNRGP